MPLRRVLVLHGWTQNATLFKERLGPLVKECEKRDIELVFLSAPHKVNVDEIIQAWTRNPAFAQDMELDTQSSEMREYLIESDPRAWWEYDFKRTRAFGLDVSLELVRETLEKQNFDGVLGFRWAAFSEFNSESEPFINFAYNVGYHLNADNVFCIPISLFLLIRLNPETSSQGAALATIISAILERPNSYSVFVQNGKPIHPPLQFCIAISGFRLIDSIVTKILEPSYQTPTFHILGRQDTIVRNPKSQGLAKLSSNKRVIIHEEAHIVPLTAVWTTFFCDFIEKASLDNSDPITQSVPRLKL